MACLAIVHHTVMIEAKCGSKTFGVMTRATIGTGYRVGGHGRRLGGRVNTGAIIVTGFTRLYCCINQAVVENATGHFESDNAMACIAIDVRYRMAEWWITWLIIL
jgi:hypothetical protein